jgi:hypothetical protein
VEELANRAARREKDLKTPPAIRRLIEKSGRALPKIRIEELDEIAEAPGKARIRKEIENSLELTIKHLEEESAKSKKDAMEKNVKREKLADELKVLGFPRDFFTIGTFGRGTVATKFVILPPAKQIAEEYKQKKAELLKMAKEEGMETKGKTLREINDELIRRQRKTSGLDQLY